MHLLLALCGVCGDNAQIRDCFAVGDCTFLSETDGFCASWNFWMNASCQSSNFFSCCLFPFGTLEAEAEFAIFGKFAGVSVRVDRFVAILG